MAQSQTPELQARRMARFVYTTLRASPQDYLGLSGPVTYDPRVLLYVDGFNLNEPLRPQLRRIAKSIASAARMDYAQQLESQAQAFERHKKDVYARGGIYQEIVDLLRSGAETPDVQEYISRHQCWPCFALATTQKELEREMAVRYAYGRCEVDFASINLPHSVLVSCRMIPHEW